MSAANQPAPASDRDDWSRHWDEYAESAQKNPAQDYRRRVILQLLNLPRGGAGVRLLDVGSGQGDLAAWIRQQYPAAEILGLELSASGVALSQKKVSNARFVQCDLLQGTPPPPQDAGWATHAVCSEVIEHVDDPQTLLANARAYMSPNCKLIVTAPGGPMSMFDKHIGHRKHFTPADMKNLLGKAGYQTQQAAGAGFPFFNLYRCVVILRGRKLIDDVRMQSGQSASKLADLVMRVFGVVFRLNLASSPLGWQMVAVARKP